MSSFSATAATRRGSVVPPLSGVDKPVVQLLPESCDILISGTGLVESILAAALAWQGSKVIHIDPNPYYGDSSSILHLEELQNWVKNVNSSKDSIYSNALLYIPQPISGRNYFIDLTPRILFAKSDVLPLLVKSRVNRYLEFKPISSFHTYENDSFDRVPGTKEDIFTDQTLSLMTKRNLMRFMKFVLEYDDDEHTGESQNPKSNTAVWKPYANKPISLFMNEKFKLESQQITELVYSIGLATTPEISTINALARMKRYLVSLGVYGNFPALYSTYGSAGELVQAFSRSAAVAGATYKLETSIVSYVHEKSGAVSVKLSDGSRIKVAEQIVLSPNSAMKITQQSIFKQSSKAAAPDFSNYKGLDGKQSISSELNSVLENGPQQQQPVKRRKSIYIVPDTITRLVAIVSKDCKDWFSDGEQAAVVVFPPKSLPSENRFAIQAIIMGHGTGQCPSGQSIWYLSTLESAENPLFDGTPSASSASSSRARVDLEEALKKLEASILRESTPDFQFGNISNEDVALRPDGTPILSSVKLGQSLQNFVPREKLQFVLKLCYTQKLGSLSPEDVQQLNNAWGINADVMKSFETSGRSAKKSSSSAVTDSENSDPSIPSDGKVTISPCPLAEITYDGIVDQALHIYEKIVGSDDDFFDLDFEDEDEQVPQAGGARSAQQHSQQFSNASSTAAGSHGGNNGTNSSLRYGGAPGVGSAHTNNESAIESDDDDEMPDFGHDMEL